jgi:hypothetical protein
LKNHLFENFIVISILSYILKKFPDMLGTPFWFWDIVYMVVGFVILSPIVNFISDKYFRKNDK